jgi:hypothetical protein
MLVITCQVVQHLLLVHCQTKKERKKKKEAAVPPWFDESTTRPNFIPPTCIIRRYPILSTFTVAARLETGNDVWLRHGSLRQQPDSSTNSGRFSCRIYLIVASFSNDMPLFLSSSSSSSRPQGKQRTVSHCPLLLQCLELGSASAVDLFFLPASNRHVASCWVLSVSCVGIEFFPGSGVGIDTERPSHLCTFWLHMTARVIYQVLYYTSIRNKLPAATTPAMASSCRIDHFSPLDHVLQRVRFKMRALCLVESLSYVDRRSTVNLSQTLPL